VFSSIFVFANPYLFPLSLRRFFALFWRLRFLRASEFKRHLRAFGTPESVYRRNQDVSRGIGNGMKSNESRKRRRVNRRSAGFWRQVL
jgi:hypothetical protein